MQHCLRLRLPIICVISVIAGTFIVNAAEVNSEARTFANEQYAFAAKQYENMLSRIRSEDRLPRTFENGRLRLVNARDWTSGFFPGSLWMLFEHTGDAKWKTAAENYTARLDSLRTYGGTHDLGFMLHCSYGNGWRLTMNTAYHEMLIAGARNLASRFNPKVGAIRSWDWGDWKFPVIIDNMMNLELLMFAHAQTGEAMFKDIAVSHANTTLKNHFRADNSSFHLVDFDPETGTVVSKETRQGHSDSSAWARGQMWGLYGFTMMHRLTKEPAYLAQARKIADFLISHTNMPPDKVPYWDFNAPKIPDEPRDASAAAIMASALLELSGSVDADAAGRYTEFAEQQLHSLASPAYRAPLGENGHFLLMHCIGDMPRDGELNAPLIYADYYFLEALGRLKERGTNSK